ncbi:hypothetical protein [Tsukamurella paurometabola]|uniref:Uncharacterized protein n=1 Tax=Tsukamurella paurometabola TaxID=2061 RepID=A0A3P8MF36_TSUPA|nr:hypothetical protein [Tsukamurella paurometabola]MBS4104204.1 hypothetical protein [Tsukamurella paurometabola]UEA84274.1 hypothetical protein LK411_05455 [Tsukamurella paurometabola]VDR41453.1 Uncharacterised protein [Tsukamurella paurometabola]
MGLSRDIVRNELTTRVAGPEDRIAIPGLPLWEVSWTVRDHLGRERSWSAPHIAEGGARRMVANLLDHRVVGLEAEAVFIDRT